MKRQKYSGIASLFIAIFSLVANYAIGQAPQTVLDCLQERYLMQKLAESGCPGNADGVTPIEWGEISSIQSLVSALNKASKVFDNVKKAYLNFDPQNKRMINASPLAPLAFLPRGSSKPEGLVLESVGLVTVENWREKLRLLASNIDQLKVLYWPYKKKTVSGWQEVTNSNTGANPAFGFGEITQPACTFHPGKPSNPDDAAGNWNPWPSGATPEEVTICGSGQAVGAISWKLRSIMYSSVVSGEETVETRDLALGVSGTRFRAEVLPPNGSGLSISNHKMYLLKFAPASLNWNNLNDIYPILNTSGKFLPSTYVVIPLPNNGDVFETPGYSSTTATPGSMAAILPPLFVEASLDIPSVEMTATLSQTPESTEANKIYNLDISNWTSKVTVTPVDSRWWRSGDYDFEVKATMILEPNFTLCNPSGTPEINVPLRHGLVEVEMDVHDLMKFHIGRGKTDGNQQAWLGVRPDGFGTMLFYGSPNEFEVICENDPTKYQDLPIGGKNLRVSEDAVSGIFTTTAKEKSGWQSRHDYYLAWLQPRILQVKGGDVLVTIDYPTCYSKVLKFFWANELMTQDGVTKLYDTSTATAFRKIELQNPSAQSGLPTSTKKLTASVMSVPPVSGPAPPEPEAVQYYSTAWATIPEAQSQFPAFSLENGTLTFTFKLHDSENDNGAPKWSKKVEIPWTNNSEGTWTISNHFEGQESVIQEMYRSSGPGAAASPLLSERPELSQRKVTVGGSERTIDIDWETTSAGSAVAAFSRPIEIRYSGQNWALNDHLIQYADGLPDKETSFLDGQPLVKDYEYSELVETITFSYGVDSQEFSKQRREYSNEFSQVDVSTSGATGDFAPAATLKYSPAGVEGSAVPWQLVEASFSSGYKENYALYVDPANGDLITHTTLGSWNGAATTAASNTAAILVTSRYGDLQSATTRLGGINGIKVAEYLGSNFTPWQAPQTITSLRGGVSELTYFTSGIAAGSIKEVTTEDGVISKYLQGKGPNHDLFGRPKGFDTGFEEITFVMDHESISANSTSGANSLMEFNDFGELEHFHSTPGPNSSFTDLTIQPTQATLNIDGRSVALETSTDGFLKSVAQGAGSRGRTAQFGVEEGVFYKKAQTLAKSGNNALCEVKTYYDPLGRVIKIKSPGADGNLAVDEWIYTDQGRTVTHVGLGPVLQNSKTSLSPDGTTVTYFVGAEPMLEDTRGIVGGKLVLTRKFNDDSTGANPPPPLSTLFEIEVDPVGRKFTKRPWSSQDSAITQVDSAPGADATQTITNAQDGSALITTFDHGLAKTILGTVRGKSVSLNLHYAQDRLDEITGHIAGQKAGLKLSPDQRIEELTTGNSTKTFTYGYPAGGFEISMTDTAGPPGKIVFDATGDPTVLEQPGTLPLAMSTVDTATGSTTAINGNLTVSTNLFGQSTAKTYSGGGGIQEAFTYHPDGSPKTITKPGSSISIAQTPTQQTKTIGNVTIAEHYYKIGLRSSVTTTVGNAITDTRTFFYDKLQMSQELHTAGPLTNFSVVRELDPLGRLWKIHVMQGATELKTFVLGYDPQSRLNKSTTSHLDANGLMSQEGPSTLTRGNLVSSWTYHQNDEEIQTFGRLKQLKNVWSEAAVTTYDYTLYQDGKHVNRLASPGVSWSGIQYDAQGQLVAAVMSSGRNVAYGYDARGNRNAQGLALPLTDPDKKELSFTTNTLDQLNARTLTKRGFGLGGSVHPQASVQFRSPFTSGWQPIPINPSGDFNQWWDLTNAPNVSSGVVPFSVVVRGTIPSSTGGNPSVTERSIPLTLPAMNEPLQYTASGELSADSLWTYNWDGLGRLTSMSSKLGPESVAFTYDADGRRLTKTHVTPDLNVQSVFLWSGWLPLAEFRYQKIGNVYVLQGRRWFQWGPDLSGTLEGAGGIGGLVAIIEENATGAPLRTLLPLQDGLGNVTAVVDNNTGKIIARYEMGPFGESLGESGEADACPFRFQTKFYDAESQHYYFGYRYYDPRTGRWMSRDPIGEAGGFNLYTYCDNKPLKKHDPLGLATLSERVGLLTDYREPMPRVNPLYEFGSSRMEYFSLAASDPLSGFSTQEVRTITPDEVRQNIKAHIQNMINEASGKPDPTPKPSANLFQYFDLMTFDDGTLSGLDQREAFVRTILESFSSDSPGYAYASNAFSIIGRARNTQEMVDSLPVHMLMALATEFGEQAFQLGRLGKFTRSVETRTLNTYGDALRGSLGPGRLSHADEWAATMSRAEGMGVKVVPEPGRMAYEPAFGSPGRLLIDPDASIGALRHEFQHILDDAALGHPGLRVIQDSNQFWGLEFRGYMQEINTARSIRDFGAGRAILQEMRERRFGILGR